MRIKDDYKSEKVINLSEYVPDYVKQRFTEGITENILNRFLTKPDFAEFNGYIGEDATSSELNPIPEDTTFRTKNQLQPIINAEIATQKYHLSFQDFIRRLQRQGVDVENFNEWGSSQQFNWVPPIDIDKLINYRDYYWVADSTPEYITIKNPVTAQEAFFEELKLSFFNTSLNRKTIEDVSDIPAATNANYVLIYEFDRNRATLARVSGGMLMEVEDSSDFSQPVNVNEFVELDTPIVSTLTTNAFTVENNYENIQSGALISIISASEEYLAVVQNANYDTGTNLTTIEVEQDLPSSPDVVSFHTLMLAEMFNYEYLNNSYIPDYSGSNSFYDIGKGLYFRTVLVDQGTLGQTGAGDVTLTDPSKNFGTILDVNKNYRLVVEQGNNSGEYDIADFLGDTIETDGTTRFFAQSGIAYGIYEIVTLDSLELSGVMQLDTVADTFSINSAVVTHNISLLINELNLSLTVKSDWADSNFWVHKNQVESFSSTKQARIPIIEYENDIPLAETSSIEYEWRYSPASDAAYIKTDTKPNLLELQPIEGADITYETSSVLTFPDIYGDLTYHVKPGDFLTFSGFTFNDGQYQVVDVEFEVLGGGNGAISRITLSTAVPDATDNNVNGRINLSTTSMGDVLIPGYDHWEFAGIRNISPSSIETERNVLLSEFITSFDYSSSESRLFRTLVGELWQEYSPITGPYSGALLELDSNLQDKCLFEDYQEGDIRVYIDGRRQYSNFQEISQTNNEYVTAIKFDNDVVITPSNRIRVEVGEYFQKDMGKRNVTVKYNSDTSPYDKYNLVDERRIEQIKTFSNEYPLFRLLDINGEDVATANQIFKFKESAEGDIIPELLKRVEIKNGGDFVFEQLLFKDKTDKLLTYRNINDVANKSIWRRGTNNEQHIPKKINSEWDIPNSWYFNMQHRNEREVSLRQLFRHFRTIIQSQYNPNLAGTNAENYYHALSTPNYGVGGTIKEHNDGLDLLASFTLLNNANPIEIIRFAGNMYQSQLNEAIQYFYSNLDYIATSPSNLFLVDFIENNKKFDQWFGDSTTLNGINGIKGMVATTAIIGATEAVTPTIIRYAGELLIRHHDGHVSNAKIPRAIKLNNFKKISRKTIKVSDASILPAVSDFDENDFITQIVTTTKEVNLYRLLSGVWVSVDVDDILANMILEIEKRLFEVAEGNKKFFDFSILNTVAGNNILLNEFIQFYNNKNVPEPLLNNGYDPGNPYTWNYAASSISVSPIDGLPYQPGLGAWQAVYNDLYGTAYPHIEPWKLQGYIQKPVWWDAEYANTDINIDRIWTLNMWNSILAGIVPNGYVLADGATISTGSAGEAQQYGYVPVNIHDSDTTDGVAPDEIIPPYWNSVNSPLAGVRSPFDRDAQDIIVNADASFLFGQQGYNEWEWMNSASYNYVRLIAAYTQDPLRVVHRFFGNDCINVDCLQVDSATESVYSHRNSKFHGELDGNELIRINGLFQWFTHFNRYNGFDGVSSEYRNLWKEWNTNLGYLFGTVINTDTFDIRSESIDITPNDFDIRFKHSEGIQSFDFRALNAKIQKMPSILSANRESSADWLFQLNFPSPSNNSIKLYKPENFPFRRISNTEFRVYNYQLLDAGVQQEIGFTRFVYPETLSLSSPTGFGVGAVQFDITVDGGTPETVIINGGDAATVGEALDSVNAQATSFKIRLAEGDIVVESLTHGPSSAIAISDSNFFSGLSISPPNIPNGQSGQKPVEFLGYFDVSVDSAEYLNTGDMFEIVNSTSFNGQYTIRRVLLNSNSNTIRVFVVESVSTPSTTIDGFLIPEKARTLPWETGQEVFFSTTGTLPGDLLDYVPYNIIKIDDYTFQIAENRQLAENGIPIEFQSGGMGSHKVGRVRFTFKPLGGKINYPWRRHFADTREEYEISGPITISTIQTLCDMAFGYEEYLGAVGLSADNDRLDNSDEDSGRSRGWQLELEKFIDWAFTFRSLKNTDSVEAEGEIDAINNRIIINGNIPWTTGSEVTVRPMAGGVVPSEVATLASFLPLYIIRNNDPNSIQLASSFDNALNGNALNLSDGTGKILILNFKNLKNKPVRSLNPYIRQFSLTHEEGLPANLIKGENLDILTTQKIYDETLTNLTEKELKFFRRDRYSVVQLLESVRNNITGGSIFIDGIEHAIIFNDYSTDGRLIYDSFLGINTPRFFIDFVRPLDRTMRPTISGLVIRGEEMTSSIEKAVNDIRYYYDTYSSFENEDSTIQARRSLGYTGREEYMDDLGVNGRSQFIFWQGYIQSKGTKKSLDAFSQHRKLQGISVDEFWAYRLCSFGDSKKYIYPELVLNTEDVSKKELRLEFTPPTGGTVGQNYTQIRLTDRSRWLNQPDLLNALSPDNAYYFETKITGIVENVQDKVYTTLLFPGTGKYLALDFPLLNVMVTYEYNNEQHLALENKDYEIVNLSLIRFTSDQFDDWENVKVAGIYYNYDAESPAKIIDKSTPAKVVADVPIWNPAFNEHNPLGRYPIDITQSNDPAQYNTSKTTTTAGFWSKDEVGRVWFDDALARYMPYYDKTIFPSVNDRSLNWGRLADFGDINLYQWVETKIPPSQWDEEAERDEQEQNKPMRERVTGKARKVLYRRLSNGQYYEEQPIILDLNITQLLLAEFSDLVDSLLLYMNATNETSIPLEIYKNGEKIEDYNFIGLFSFQIHLINLSVISGGDISPSDYITVVKPVPVPTEEELDDGDFVYDIPHTSVTRFDTVKQEEETVYYYWVQDLKNEKLIDNTSLTLFDARREMKNMTRPYMIIGGLQFEGSGYGVLFGSTFDPDDNNLPTRFTQCIVKGLKNTVKDNNRYVLRLVKNFILRDKLNERDLSLKNVHWEWKLFRKNQPSKVDRVLWDKVIESVCGLEFKEGALTDTVIPSFERETYDTFVTGATSRIGLGSGQVLLDRNNIIQLILSVLLDPNRQYSTVNITEFVNFYNINNPEEALLMLESIYDGFTIEEVNAIFFEILEESVLIRKKHPDFLKTSWVSIDVSADANVNPLNIISIAETHPSDRCFLDTSTNAA